jgi:hypothetical protein
MGYLCAALTVVYVISGVAVNHVDAWNPTYDIERQVANVGPHPDVASPAAIHALLERLGLETAYRATFRPDSATFRIFLEDGTVDVALATGQATVEIVRERPVLGAVNFLHLNHPKKLWTWMADLYAVALGLLAITGLFVIKGKKGITGRGAWLTAIGIGIPFVFLWLYR